MRELLPDPDAVIARYVKKGMHVHCASTPSRANALIGALARAFADSRGLTVSIAAVHGTAHALALSACVDRMITCFLGDVYPSPRPNQLYSRLAEGDPYPVELWSLLSLQQRLEAAAHGLPYAVTTSLLGSDLPHAKDGVTEIGSNRPGDKRALLVPALRPDITLLHGACADPEGNILIHPPVGEGTAGSLAARLGVLASVERIVPDLAAVPTRAGAVVIPGQRVLAVCAAPFGAHPQGQPGTDGDPGYLDDYEFLAEIDDQCRTPADARRWYDAWVGGVGGHTDYLDRLGRDRLAALRTIGASAPARTPVAPDAEVSEQRRLVAITARSIVDLVLKNGYDTILAGIGASHLAAWLARALLERSGVNIRVCAETGMYGMDPWPGDVYLFSQRHVDRCEALSGFSDVLGGLVAGNSRRCLGVLAAAQVDPEGNINTALLPDGRWLTGSGGANDIASHVDCVVACTARPHRFPDRVAHVTSPGSRVRAVACQFGRFDRDGPSGRFRLSTWFSPPGCDDPRTALRALTQWPAESDAPAVEPEITAEESALLASLDPAAVYT
jgi:acyl CoA:acetate/3-ketoacid CoA transferase alpha subunit/acyl CoA:acetate/3-ketoacid CoA transferase beta subunit